MKNLFVHYYDVLLGFLSGSLRSSSSPVSPGCQVTSALYGHNTCNFTFVFHLVQSERDSMGMPSDVTTQRKASSQG